MDLKTQSLESIRYLYGRAEGLDVQREPRGGGEP